MENLLSYLFPEKCIFCGTLGDIFCDKCLSDCTVLKQQYCIVCDTPSEFGLTHAGCTKERVPPTQLICVYSYKDNIRSCIKYSKYGAKQFLSLKRLSREAAQLCKEFGHDFADFLCLPIPSSKQKINYRGFNQANMIAEEFSRVFHLELNKNALLKVVHTAPQFTLNREERRENVKNTFLVKDPPAVLNRKILLIDDICTTGSTFLESTRTLYEAGALEVKCFALSKREKF